MDDFRNLIASANQKDENSVWAILKDNLPEPYKAHLNANGDILELPREEKGVLRKHFVENATVNVIYNACMENMQAEGHVPTFARDVLFHHVHFV